MDELSVGSLPVCDGTRVIAIDQSAQRRIAGKPLQDTDAMPTGEVAHGRPRTRRIACGGS